MVAKNDSKKKDELIQLRVEKEFSDQLTALAKEYCLPVSALLRAWIAERLRSELLTSKALVQEWQARRLESIQREILPNLPPGPALVVHARPLTPGVEIDGSKLRDTQGTLVPLRYTLPAVGRITRTGYHVKRLAGEQTVAEGQVFKTGQVENVTTIPSQGSEILGLALDRAIFEIVQTLIGVLAGQKVPLPYHISVTVLNAKGHWLVVQESIFQFPHVPIEENCFTLPEIIVSDFAQAQTGGPLEQLLKPALDELWQASGIKGSLSYAEEGKWRAV